MTRLTAGGTGRWYRYPIGELSHGFLNSLEAVQLFCLAFFPWSSSVLLRLDWRSNSWRPDSRAGSDGESDLPSLLAIGYPSLRQKLAVEPEIGIVG